MSLKNKLDETKLRSLKYGENEPYIVIDIKDQSFNNQNSSFINNALNLLPDNFNILGNDINLRNTRVGAATIDTIRIGKYLTDPKHGPQFITKQIGLQAMNVNSNFGEGPISNQLYNPINTISQVTLSGIGGHLKRQGIIPGQISDFFDDLETYEKIKNRENKGDSEKASLVKLKNKLFNLTPPSDNSVIDLIKQKSKFISNIINIINKGDIIYSYLGGPESFLGLGITNIKRYQNSLSEIYDEKRLRGFIPFTAARELNLNSNNIKNGTKVIYSLIFGDTIVNKAGVLYPEFKTIVDNDLSNETPLHLNQTGSYVPSTLFKSFKEAKKYTQNPDTPYNYASNKSSLPTDNKNIIYQNTNGQQIIIGGSWFVNSREERIGLGNDDKINLTPIFTAEKAQNDYVRIDGKKYNIRDLAKFRIETILDSTFSNWMIFRAYINNISDTVNSNWSDIEYINRSEKLHIYNGFNRSINVDFKVATLSKNEMKTVYQKLNYLMSGMAGKYNNGLLEGTFSRLTIGNYIDRQHGIIQSLTYKVNMNETPWEIAMKEPEGGEKLLILPHVIDVSLTFIPVGVNNKGKNELPQRADNNDLSFIAQNDNTDVNYITGSINKGEFITYNDYIKK